MVLIDTCHQHRKITIFKSCIKVCVCAANKNGDNDRVCIHSVLTFAFFLTIHYCITIVQQKRNVNFFFLDRYCRLHMYYCEEYVQTHTRYIWKCMHSITSGTAWSPNIDLSTATAFATTTSSGKDSNLTASSPEEAKYTCVATKSTYKQLPPLSLHRTALLTHNAHTYIVMYVTQCTQMYKNTQCRNRNSNIQGFIARRKTSKSKSSVESLQFFGWQHKMWLG